MKWELKKPVPVEKSRTDLVRSRLGSIKDVTVGVSQNIYNSLKKIKGLYKMTVILSESQPYIIEGTTLDQDWLYKNRHDLELTIIDEMRKDGYVPVLDVASTLKELKFDEEQNNFSYKLEFPGYFIGPHAQDYEGIFIQQGIAVGRDGEFVINVTDL